MFHTYEFHIRRESALPANIHTSRHMSDYAAVRRAQTLCPAGAQLEVWRGSVCIYSTFRAAA